MKTFKITYKSYYQQPEWSSRLIEAYDVTEALSILRDDEGRMHSIRSISLQCAGTTKSGNPCQRFTGEEYCCKAHEPKPPVHEGSASVIVAIRGGHMTVHHGSDTDYLLAEMHDAPPAAWTDFWKALDALGLQRTEEQYRVA